MKDLTGDDLAKILRDIADSVEGVPADRIHAAMDFTTPMTGKGVDERGAIKYALTGDRQYRLDIHVHAGKRRRKLELEQ